MSFPKINVLMSTYNGQRFLDEQISSILNQTGVEACLIVRDDGSTDSTCTMLNDYQTQGKLIWYAGENLRPARSFLHLLSNAPYADYYAFSDQDDYWMPDKLCVAVQKLIDYNDIPALYFSQTQLADHQLNKIETPRISPLLTFGESLVYQFVGGCTMVMNAKMREVISRYTPEYIPMHDVWIYVIAMGVGAKVIFDANPHILYRQHGGNVVGQGFGWKTAWKRRFNRIVLNKEHARYRMACELQRGFSGTLSDENRKILDKFLAGRYSFKKRLSLLTDPNYHCANKSVYKNFLISVLLNTY